MTDSGITLGIPCYNEADTIETTLQYVAQLGTEPDRILCADDGSSDGTVDILRQLPNVDLIEHDQNLGRGEARNTILNATETPYLAMIDADIHPCSGWLSTLIEVIEETGAGAVGGDVIEVGKTNTARWRRTRMTVNDYDEAGEVTHVAGGNVLFRSHALRDVGGWPELQSTEDKKVCFRLRDAGYSVHYTPDAVVEHVGEDTVADVLRNLWRWHFESRNEPERLSDLPLRAVHHAAKGARYCVEDIVSGRFWALPISARLPVEFLREDLERLSQ